MTVAAALAVMPCAAHANAPAELIKGPGFLVGDWDAGQGELGDKAGSVKGVSRITREADGRVLLRRDHTDLFDPAGKPAGSFEQIMLIYPENATLHADYLDETHAIHYTQAQMEWGRWVVFSTEPQAGVPSFRLRYELAGPATLAVAFSMAAPGSAEFHAVATGVLHKAR